MSDQPDSLAAALILLQSRLPRITKDDVAEVETKSGGKYRYSYANLASIHDAIFPLLADCHLCWICAPMLNADGQFVLRYQLRHATDEKNMISGDYPLPTSGTPQAIGSAITYARRYTLTAVLGIAPAEDDDDAQAAEAAAKARPASDPASGRMSRTEARDHNRLIHADDPPRRADRLRGQLPDDEFNTPDPDEPASITDGQRARLMASYGKAGIGRREDRLAYAMSALDLPELASSNDLSMRQAGELIAKLESEVQQ